MSDPFRTNAKPTSPAAIGQNSEPVTPPRLQYILVGTRPDMDSQDSYQQEAVGGPCVGLPWVTGMPDPMPTAWVLVTKKNMNSPTTPLYASAPRFPGYP